jgi:hypothetical protein
VGRSGELVLPDLVASRPAEPAGPWDLRVHKEHTLIGSGGTYHWPGPGTQMYCCIHIQRQHSKLRLIWWEWLHHSSSSITVCFLKMYASKRCQYVIYVYTLWSQIACPHRHINVSVPCTFETQCLDRSLYFGIGMFIDGHHHQPSLSNVMHR